jgi:hypothetical protein
MSYRGYQQTEDDMTKTQIVRKVREALHTERALLIGKNEGAANAITDFLLDAGEDSYVRLYEMLTAKEPA